MVVFCDQLCLEGPVGAEAAVFVVFYVAELVGGEGGAADAEISDVEMMMSIDPVGDGRVVDELMKFDGEGFVEDAATVDIGIAEEGGNVMCDDDGFLCVGGTGEFGL